MQLEAYALRSDLDLRIEPSPLPRHQVAQLPAGPYALVFRHADGGVRAHRFEVIAGKHRLVTPTPWRSRRRSA